MSMGVAQIRLHRSGNRELIFHLSCFSSTSCHCCLKEKNKVEAFDLVNRRMYLIYKRCMKEWHLTTCVCVYETVYSLPYQGLVSELSGHTIYFWLNISFEAHLVRQNDTMYIAFRLWLHFLGQDLPFLFCESKTYPFKWNFCFIVFRKWVMFRVSRQVWERKKDEINSVFHHLCTSSYVYILPFSTDNWDSLMTFEKLYFKRILGCVQWCAGKCLITDSWGSKMPWFVVLPIFVFWIHLLWLISSFQCGHWV